MMGDRIVKCVGTLQNDNKDGIHQTCDFNSQSEITNIDECKWDFMYMLKSHKLNCELNCCIENTCCDMINYL